MNDFEQQECKRLIYKYRKTREKVIRDKLFFILKPHLARWIKAILGKKGKFISEQELLSDSWEVFDNGLLTYEKIYPIPKHFYIAAVRLYRSRKDNEIRKGNIESAYDDEISCISNIFKDNSVYVDILMSLKSFYETLPDDYKIVFEDSLMTIKNKRDCYNRSKESNLAINKYYESKKIFIWFINFLGYKNEKTNK